MYTPQEIELALDQHDWKLSETLYKIERFAQAQGLTALETWSRQEMQGYPPGYEVVKERPYRVVNVIWHDRYGRVMQIQPDLILVLGRQPLPMGIQSLEGYEEKGLTLQNPAMIAKLNGIATVPVGGATVDGSEIRTVLSRIRMEARRRLHDAIPRIQPQNIFYSSPDFASLVPDVGLATLLTRRWSEANYCFQATAYLSAIIMLGSILEGVLLSKVQQNPAQANSAKASPKDIATGKPLPFRDWTLQSLIDVAHECGWLKKHDRDFSHTVRDYRNFVHPNKEWQEGVTFDAGMCRVIFEVVGAALGK